jgi:hypothetical protein
MGARVISARLFNVADRGDTQSRSGREASLGEPGLKTVRAQQGRKLRYVITV